MSRYLTAAFYKFVDLPDCAQLQLPLLTLCQDHQVKGTILLAREGVNGTIAGSDAAIDAVMGWLRAEPRFADLEYKSSWSGAPPFHRMKVRLKKEIVSMQVAGLNPAVTAGQYVTPEHWNALAADPDVVLIDAHNDYEVAIGTFDRAIDPKTRTFSELPGWLEAHCAPGKLLAAVDGRRPRVAMFCTGGIRCEKSTALLRKNGFDEVYHLQGGILKYLEVVPAEQSLWQGECFVFDERVSVGHGLRQGPLELCRSCRLPIGERDKSLPEYVAGVSCARCFASRSESQKLGFAERQRQVDLARVRGQIHVGADMSPRP